ncbi:MAG TPA: competence/damage-inducible protein A [Armatimonadetes bacterium]|nr:competence/damage-inducible protein A [Armatimonadota bacterium]
MKAELISVGTELLLGEIVDTNAAYMSQRLAEIGVDVHFRHTVGDNLDRIVSVLELALSRSDAVLISGGLGPTQDDLTRESIAQATGRPLVSDPDAVTHLREYFARRGFMPTQNNLKQATVPEGGRLLDNTCGTAPGLFVEHEGKLIFAIPGPPSEMREMMHLQVLPITAERLGTDLRPVFTRVLRFSDIGESTLTAEIAEIIDNQTDPTVAPYAKPGEVTLRIATKAESEAKAAQRLNEIERALREQVGSFIYGVDDETMEVAAGKALREKHATVAVAESCTGGLVASRITDVSGSSEYMLGGVVAYANEIKQRLLGVPPEVLAEHGAVSEETARAMAAGVRKLLGADYGVATTGIAGPTGGTAEKPVGLVYIAVADAGGVVVTELNWPGTREQFKQRVSQTALNMLRKRVLGIEVQRR